MIITNWKEFFIRPYTCIIDRNVANGPTLMLLSTATHTEDISAKIYAPNMAAPQTDPYLALRRMEKCS